MNTVLIDYNKLDGLLNTLSSLNFKPGDGCIDTWKDKSKDCTQCDVNTINLKEK